MGAKSDTSVIKAYTSGLITQGKVLDLGGGDGRNAIDLASRGFEVEVVDKCPEAIEQLNERAKTRKVDGNVTSIICDINDFKFTPAYYSTVVCTFVLHFLKKEDFHQVIDGIMKVTKPGGTNIIVDFTTDGPMYKPTSTRYWLSPNELLDIYSGWEIVSYSEKPTPAKNHERHNAARLIAIKP